MTNAIVPSELIDHLCRNSRLNAQEAEHIVNEVLAYFAETPDELGRSNSDIFLVLQHELQNRRFASKPMSTRQIRRAIYG